MRYLAALLLASFCLAANASQKISNVATQAISLSASGDVGTAGQDYCLLGFFVSATSSGTMTLKYGGSGGTLISGTITPAAGQFYNYPIYVPGGLYFTKGGTSISVTFFVAPGSNGSC